MLKLTNFNTSGHKLSSKHYMSKLRIIIYNHFDIHTKPKQNTKNIYFIEYKKNGKSLNLLCAAEFCS